MTKMKLASLISSGKDSLFAAYLEKEKGNEIKCFITIESDNPYSYMFHPDVSLVKLQAKSAGIPLITENTKGKKEEELRDLKKAIEKAKKEYGIEGVTTGALFSDYQATRINKICEELGLKCISPLWHMDQEKELRSLLENYFEFIIVKVAAEGLDKKWLGKIVDEKTIDRLKIVNEDTKINIAGEGGEYESLVLNCPLFKKRIEIKKFEIKEDGRVAWLDIKKAKLI